MAMSVQHTSQKTLTSQWIKGGRRTGARDAMEPCGFRMGNPHRLGTLPHKSLPSQTTLGDGRFRQAVAPTQMALSPRPPSMARAAAVVTALPRPHSWMPPFPLSTRPGAGAPPPTRRPRPPPPTPRLKIRCTPLHRIPAGSPLFCSSAPAAAALPVPVPAP